MVTSSKESNKQPKNLAETFKGYPIKGNPLILITFGVLEWHTRLSTASWRTQTHFTGYQPVI